ncbi:MAG: hypothetical protein LBN30_04815 [Oscillospiraceae bacterium]|jgi:hypothetical protein|nr:hypothetical protein [Oscillospiraceae bacterium]
MEDSNVNLELLPKDGERLLAELKAGKMVIARSGNDFLYVMEFDGAFHMFSHTPGASGGGQKQFPRNEKYVAVIRKVAELSDMCYMADFDRTLNLYSAMATAEVGILSMFPGTERDADADVDFAPWDRDADNDEQEAAQEPSFSGDIPSGFPAGFNSDFPGN